MAMLPGSRETGSALGASLLSRMSTKRLRQAVWIFEVLLPFRRSDSVRRGEAQMLSRCLFGGRGVTEFQRQPAFASGKCKMMPASQKYKTI